MALENISNVPEVCSESLLEHFIFQIFLGEAPQTPLRTFPWDACGVFVALCPTGPPLGKNPGSAPAQYSAEVRQVWCNGSSILEYTDMNTVHMN